MKFLKLSVLINLVLTSVSIAALVPMDTSRIVGSHVILGKGGKFFVFSPKAIQKKISAGEMAGLLKKFARDIRCSDLDSMMLVNVNQAQTAGAIEALNFIAPRVKLLYFRPSTSGVSNFLGDVMEKGLLKSLESLIIDSEFKGDTDLLGKISTDSTPNLKNLHIPMFSFLDPLTIRIRVISKIFPRLNRLIIEYKLLSTDNIGIIREKIKELKIVNERGYCTDKINELNKLRMLMKTYYLPDIPTVIITTYKINESI